MIKFQIRLKLIFQFNWVQFKVKRKNFWTLFRFSLLFLSFFLFFWKIEKKFVFFLKFFCFFNFKIKRKSLKEKKVLWFSSFFPSKKSGKKEIVLSFLFLNVDFSYDRVYIIFGKIRIFLIILSYSVYVYKNRSLK